MDGSPRVRKYGSVCSVEGCEREHAARGYCISHWRRDRVGLDVSEPIVSKLITDDLLIRLRTYAPEGAPDECWEWTRALNKGYGAMAVHGSRMRQAHVVAWELHHGRALPAGMVIRHNCDNPPCTNPAHLVLGTHGDNVHDRVDRGREAYNGTGFRLRTPDEVAAMRRLHSEGVSMAEIGRRFGCSRVTASRIVRGKTFAGSTRRKSAVAKLTDSEVRAVRELADSGISQQAIADQFGMHQSTISAIVRRTTYQHIN